MGFEKRDTLKFCGIEAIGQEVLQQEDVWVARRSYKSSMISRTNRTKLTEKKHKAALTVSATFIIKWLAGYAPTQRELQCDVPRSSSLLNAVHLENSECDRHDAKSSFLDLRS